MNLVPMNAILRHNAAVFGPDAAALIDGDAVISWSQLEVAANRRARLIQAQGIGPGDVVTFNLPNGLEFFETTFALWKLGATPNPISPKLPARELGAMLEAARPTLFIGDGEGEGAPAGLRRLPRGVDPVGLSGQPLEEVVSQQWKAITSGGSTGRPKVIVDHRRAVFDVDTPTLGQPAGGVILNPGPLYHNAPFVVAHEALCAGAAVVNMDRFDAERALALIEAYRVQWVNFVPTMMARIWRLPEAVRARYDVSSLQTVWHMASAMPVWLKEAWIDWLGAETIWELYGGTERLGSTVIRGDDWLMHKGSVGRPTPGCQVQVVGAEGQPCAPREIGEIFFLPREGAGATYHYLGADSKRRSDGWESLGDIGWLDEDGFLYLADRRADLILRGGANIYPAEVESALDEHPDVASSIVVGLPDEDFGQRVHAIVQWQPGVATPAAALQTFLLARLSRNKVPESFEWTTEDLRDDAGKARRGALREARLTLLQTADCAPDWVVDLRTPARAKA
ncbi:MAG: AMP-binding protein [Alphaproteobacteria bacterium]|nr:AMP-binding protein [Alphaproteobacteria bacterium]MBU2092860.1 AMP-binding protein [Alphaproteobacteria bacterium]MBU2149636.1 AMP-binding protein [Alphaproteobacteria bacterium]MBU2363261.1 AMP-binding protein [Alphaproteobacteria bacterium]